MSKFVEFLLKISVLDEKIQANGHFELKNSYFWLFSQFSNLKSRFSANIDHFQAISDVKSIFSAGFRPFSVQNIIFSAFSTKKQECSAKIDDSQAIFGTKLLILEFSLKIRDFCRFFDQNCFKIINFCWKSAFPAHFLRKTHTSHRRTRIHQWQLALLKLRLQMTCSSTARANSHRSTARLIRISEICGRDSSHKTTVTEKWWAEIPIVSLSIQLMTTDTEFSVLCSQTIQLSVHFRDLRLQLFRSLSN